METAPAKRPAPFLRAGNNLGTVLSVPSALVDALSAASAKPSPAFAIITIPTRPGVTCVCASAAAANTKHTTAFRILDICTLINNIRGLAAPNSGLEIILLYVERRVVNHERGLETAVLAPDEPDLHGLSFEVDHAERMLLVGRSVFEVAERAQSRQHYDRAADQSHLKRTERRDRACLV